ncbi:MAG TPA: hypothetical protein VJ757_08680, partial [Pseudonocardiaceae bacterium]|nr:hypothetical protein [Pseudonocardiaceae bacterium]
MSSPAATPDDGESATSVDPTSSPDGQSSDDTGREDPAAQEPKEDSVTRIMGLLSPNRPAAGILFVLAIALLIVELLSIQGVPPGVLAAVSFVVSVLVAPFIHYHKLQPVRHLVIPLAAASGALTIARWPVIFQHNPADLAVQVLTILGLVWILAKMLLLQRFSAKHCCRTPFVHDELKKLLPFQRSYLEQMCRAIFSAPIGQGARVVQLEANWGQGKSFLIERLELFLQSAESAQGDCAVVVINVWEQESEPNL